MGVIGVDVFIEKDMVDRVDIDCFEFHDTQPLREEILSEGLCNWIDSNWSDCCRTPSLTVRNNPLDYLFDICGLSILDGEDMDILGAGEVCSSGGRICDQRVARNANAKH